MSSCELITESNREPKWSSDSSLHIQITGEMEFPAIEMAEEFWPLSSQTVGAI